MTQPSDQVSQPPPPKKRVLIVDDHPAFRFGLCGLLSRIGGFEVCGEAWNFVTGLQALRDNRPEIALVDISMPGSNGIDLVKSMLAQEPGLIVMVVSMHEESLYALRALRAGAKGYVMKEESLECIAEALHRVIQGGIYVSPRLSEQLVFKAVHGSDSDTATPLDRLSDRELEVLGHLGKGASSREIAARLNLGIKTVETHRAHLKKKLGFQRQEELVRFAAEWHIAQCN